MIVTLAAAYAEAGQFPDAVSAAQKAHDVALARGDKRLAELKTQVERDKADHLDQMRQTARLQNDAVSFKAQVDNLNRERGRLRARSEQAAEHLASLDLELQELVSADDALQTRLNGARQVLAEAKQERERFVGLRDETGLYYVVDRMKDVIIRGGENVYCAEVEAVLLEHPRVRDAAVVGLPHQDYGEEVAAVIQVAAKDLDSAAEDDIRQSLTGRLARFKIPTTFRLVEAELPRTATGKILKRELRTQYF